MAQEASLVSLEELLEETGETDNDNEILDRIKLLAKDKLPVGWTTWKVTRLTKEEIFGDSIHPHILNKLRFALPTAQLVKAFLPETTCLSKKEFRDLKMKMLDWPFTRALITSPPAICNKIRGSAAATELFNHAMSRKKADRTSSPEADREPTSMRKRRKSSDSESSDVSDTELKLNRLVSLKQRMNDMISVVMERIDLLAQVGNDESQDSSMEDEVSSDDANYPPDPTMSKSPDNSPARPSGSGLEENSVQPNLSELELVPAIKVAEPMIPASSEHNTAGIACQTFNSEEWNHKRHTETVKQWHVSPLKINPELSDLRIRTSPLLSEHDGVLGTIIHGLISQRKALPEVIRKAMLKCPAATEALKRLVGEGSPFQQATDELLQFVCAQRAETIDMRRRAFETRSDALSSKLQQIPPSPTHLFQEDKLSKFIEDHGGVAYIFPSLFVRRHTFQQSRLNRQSGVRRPRSKNPLWPARPSRTSRQKRQHPSGQSKYKK